LADPVAGDDARSITFSGVTGGPKAHERLV